jgi:hypothetical protein
MDRKMLAASLVVIIVVISGIAASVLLIGGGRTEPITEDDDRTARAWVDLAAIGSSTVEEEDRWGSVETFAGAATGAISYHRQVSLYQADAAESVVLDGKVWCMMRSNSSDLVLMRYTPAVEGLNWNISFECYAPQAGDPFDPAFGKQHIGLTATLVDVDGQALASVDLSYGTPGDNCIVLRDATGTAIELSGSMAPSTAVKGPTEGFAPERYIVSFQRAGKGDCVVAVMRTTGTVVGRGNVTVPVEWEGPKQLVLRTTSTVLTRQGIDPNVPWSVATYSGAWVVDNLACRGATARYPLASPLYEYSWEGAAAPAGALPFGAPLEGAEVGIAGQDAVFNQTTGRYETELDLGVGWGRCVPYTVALDGVEVNDTMYLTTTSVAEHAQVGQWWNGWDWVSVFGEDDCIGPGDILHTYVDYDHPLTAYVMSYVSNGGSSQDILEPPYVEIGLHNPHDWEGGSTKFWNEAVTQANNGMRFLKDHYEYASRWDDPDMGGQGDTYISMANPGNKATYQQLYALSAAGIRIDGRSSDKAAGSPGNHTQLGAWYDAGGYLGTGAGWQPYMSIDLMDAARQLSWDGANNWSLTFGIVDAAARNHGVVRAYGHPSHGIMIPDMMHWIDDPKTNYSLENWKATDGEVASYIYGRWSTDLRFDADGSDGNTWSYQVSRADPRAAGYWSVPVTIVIDLEGRTLKDIVVNDGGLTVKMSTGSLADLNGCRVMQSGYDLRDGKLYVSGMWDSDASLTVLFEQPPGSLDIAPSEPPMMMRTV